MTVKYEVAVVETWLGGMEELTEHKYSPLSSSLVLGMRSLLVTYGSDNLLILQRQKSQKDHILVDEAAFSFSNLCYFSISVNAMFNSQIR